MLPDKEFRPEIGLLSYPSTHSSAFSLIPQRLVLASPGDGGGVSQRNRKVRPTMKNSNHVAARSTTLDRARADAAAFRISQEKINGQRLPKSVADRLALIAVRAWAQNEENISPLRSGDKTISHFARRAQSNGEPVYIVRQSRDDLNVLRYTAKALRFAFRLDHETTEGALVDAAVKLTKLNFDYALALRHAKRFMSLKRKFEMKAAMGKRISSGPSAKTPKGYSLTCIRSEHELAETGKRLRNCLATQGEIRRHAVLEMKAGASRFFSIRNPAGDQIGLLKAGCESDGAWDALEFRGILNDKVRMPRASIWKLLKFAEIKIADCSDLHDLGLSDSLSEVLEKRRVSISGEDVRLEISAAAIGFFSKCNFPILVELKDGSCRILGERRCDAHDRATFLLLATQRIWGPVLQAHGSPYHEALLT
jgi:hypothetical protein